MSRWLKAVVSIEVVSTEVASEKPAKSRLYP